MGIMTIPDEVWCQFIIPPHFTGSWPADNLESLCPDEMALWNSVSELPAMHQRDAAQKHSIHVFRLFTLRFRNNGILFGSCKGLLSAFRDCGEGLIPNNGNTSISSVLSLK